MTEYQSVPGWETAGHGRRNAIAAIGAVAVVVVITLVVVLLVTQRSDGPVAVSLDPAAQVGADPFSPTVAVGDPVSLSVPAETVADLGLASPVTRPSCDGSGIVVLGSAVTPGRYAADVSSFLGRFPGSSYLRTDASCPSLRQAIRSTPSTGQPVTRPQRSARRSLQPAATRTASGSTPRRTPPERSTADA